MSITIPNKAQYGAEEITDPNVVVCRTLADYYKLTGRFPKVYDRMKSDRPWFAIKSDGSPWDERGPDFASLGLGLDHMDNPVQVPFDVPAADAGHPNVQALGSFQTYASYVAGLPPTQSYMQSDVNGNFQKTPLAPALLFTVDQATALVNKITADTGMPVSWSVNTSPGSGDTYVFMDNRLAFWINIGGQQFQMGSSDIQHGKFEEAAASGVGYPGTWTFTPASGGSSASLTWKADVPNPGNPVGSLMYWPTRALVSPPEKLVVVFGNNVAVENTSIPQPVTPTGGGFTDADRSVLQQILAYVTPK